MDAIVPKKVTLSNVSNKIIGFVPFQECFSKQLLPNTSLTFTAKNPSPVLYYSKLTDGKLIVNIDDEVSVVCGNYNSVNNTFTAGASFVFDKNKVFGKVPYKPADSILGLAAGNRVCIKIKNSLISAKSDLPSGIILKVTNGDGFNEYTKDAFEDDGSIIIVLNVSKVKPIDVLIKWNSTDDFQKFVLDCSDSEFLKDGETATNIANTEIASSQALIFTNTTNGEVGVVPYKGTFAFKINAQDSLSLTIDNAEVVMYYLQQNNQDLSVVLG